jgi:DNA polymerase III subunit delta
MNYAEIIKELESKRYRPIYFLMGDEPYFIDKITSFIEKNVLTESEKAFNQVVVYGSDTDIGNVINSARRYPMMSNQQVVIVKEAQNIKNIDDLVYYADNPLTSTILVVNYKFRKIDKRKKLYLAIAKNGIVLESNKLYDSQVPDWITNSLKEKKVEIKPAAAVLLTEFLGNDLGKIVNELDKLILTLPAGKKEIDAAHIEKNIGISKDFNNFELQNALIGKDYLKANRIINYFEKNPKNNPIVLTITSLYMFFTKVLLYQSLPDKSKQNVASVLKINPYFVGDYQKAARIYSFAKVKNIISYLREYDIRSKGIGNVSTSDGDLMKELIYKIMH